jgi:cell division septation protein DedD
VKKLFKFVFIVAIASAVGYSIYYGGKKGVAMYRVAKEAEKAEIARKKSSAKMEQDKLTAEKDALAASEKEAFTFFETLGDPEMNKIVGLNNNIQSQPVVPPRPLENKPVKKTVAPQEAKEKADVPSDGVKHVSFLSPLDNQESKPAPSGETAGEKNKKAHPEQSAPKKPALKGDKDDDKTYTVQISSFKELAPAQSMQAKLQKKGYPAYLLSVDTPGKGVIYRVFLGKYIGQDKAKTAANKVRQEDNINGVVVLLQD